MTDKDIKAKAEETQVQNSKEEKVLETPKQAKSGAKVIIPCYIQSRKDKDITLAYDGKDMILAPRQKLYIPDKSKLSRVNPRDVLITKA